MPFVALNVGMINGGVAVNVVPDRCDVDIGLRVLPGMSSDALVDRVREVVAPVLAGERWELERSGDSPPFLLSADRPVFRDVTGLLGPEGRGEHRVRDRRGLAPDRGIRLRGVRTR